MKIKKIISISLSLLLMIGTFSKFSVFAEEEPWNNEYLYRYEDYDTERVYSIYKHGDFKYSFTFVGGGTGGTENGVIIHGYVGYDSIVHIPSTIHNLPVVRIYDFNGQDEYNYEWEEEQRIEKLIKEVYIPATVNKTHWCAFAGYTNLEKVVFEDNSELKYVEPQTFEGCTSLKSINLPESVKSIGAGAFQNSGLTSITIPKNVKTISNYVFANCKNLKSINLPETVKSIGESAFQNSGLTSITIPKNVKIVYKKAFYGCKNLTSVKFAGKVNNIGRSAFSKCANLKTVNFTKGYLKKVYDYAFYKCEKLDKITISNTKNVPSIHKSAFNKAKSGIKFYVKNNTVAKKLKAKLQKTNIKKAKIYRSAPILIYKNVG